MKLFHDMYCLNRYWCSRLLLFHLLLCFLPHSLSAESQVSFLVSQWNICGDAENVFLKIQGISVTECVFECAIHPHCKAVNFKGHSFCELLNKESNTDQTLCVYIKKSDIVISNIPCEGCSDEKKCELSSGQCVFAECIRPVVENGIVLGNVYSIGKKLGVRCDISFKKLNKVSSSICLQNGTWSHTLSCIAGSNPNDAESTTDAVTLSTAGSQTETTNPIETTNNCYSISILAPNEWCMINCNHVPPNCPASFCQCY